MQQRFAAIFLIMKNFEMIDKKEKKIRASNGGFTLIEMLVVISVIGILVSIAGYNNARVLRHSKDAALKVELSQLRNAVYQFSLNNSGKFPDTLDALKDSVLRKVPHSWSGSTATGTYYLDALTGEVRLYDYVSSAPSEKKDLAGFTYGSY